MVVVPVAIPITTPVLLSIVATDVLVLLHDPPEVALLRVAAEPTHIADGPVIAEGGALTVRVLVIIQPVPIAYVIVVVPDTMPVTIPEIEPIVAIPETLLLHVPPDGDDDNVADVPAHTLDAPPIAAGNGFIVTMAVLEHAAPVI
jgi:hypothetical protein